MTKANKVSVGIGKAAELLGISRRTVYQWIYSDKLKARKNTEGEWEIALEDIHSILKEAHQHFDKGIDLAKGLDTVEEFYTDRMAKVFGDIFEACHHAAAAYKKAMDKYETNKEVVTNAHLRKQIEKLDEVMTRYRKLVSFEPFVQELRGESQKLMREGDIIAKRRGKAMEEHARQLVEDGN